MKSVFDEDVFSKINFMTISTKIINALFFCKWIETGNLSLEDCIDIVRRYSEEIEYCEENIEKLSELLGTRHWSFTKILYCSMKQSSGEDQQVSARRM